MIMMDNNNDREMKTQTRFLKNELISKEEEGKEAFSEFTPISSQCIFSEVWNEDSQPLSDQSFLIIHCINHLIQSIYSIMPSIIQIDHRRHYPINDNNSFPYFLCPRPCLRYRDQRLGFLDPLFRYPSCHIHILHIGNPNDPLSISCSVVETSVFLPHSFPGNGE